MTSAVEFLGGAPNHKGRTVETVMAAGDEWLERHHDWVQWAFPNQEPSAFNPDAPVWTAAEARALAPTARANLRRMLRRFEHFLQRTRWWRAPSDHNHARISRVLLCLRDAGLYDEARAFYRFVVAAPEPGARSRTFWRGALVSASLALRAFEANDVDACVAVLASSVPDYATEDELGQFRRFLSKLEQWSCRYVVGELGGAIVACGGLSMTPERGLATFCWGLVERSLHHHRIGTRLTLERLGWIVDDARYERVELDTSDRTRAFFARFGFEDHKVTPDGYAPGLHRHDMTLRLDDARRASLRAMIAANGTA